MSIRLSSTACPLYCRRLTSCTRSSRSWAHPASRAGQESPSFQTTRCASCLAAGACGHSWGCGCWGVGKLRPGAHVVHVGRCGKWPAAGAYTSSWEGKLEQLSARWQLSACGQQSHVGFGGQVSGLWQINHCWVSALRCAPMPFAWHSFCGAGYVHVYGLSACVLSLLGVLLSRTASLSGGPRT